MANAAVALFAGSFLLFLIQPLLGRTLLPIFGGSAAVWTVCLAAYQLLLLIGYLYAHALTRLAPTTQRRLHLAALTLATGWTLLFALTRHRLLAHLGASACPSLEVLLGVVLVVGLPYTLLAAGSSLVQAWHAADRPPHDSTQRTTYRLYALSNLGSFAGLLIFPLLLEPLLSLTWHWWLLALGMVLYLSLLAKMRVAQPAPQPLTVTQPTAPAATPFELTWFLLPGVSAFLVNAIIAHLFADVTPLPLVWVAMLAAFLLSYVVGFSGGATRWRLLWPLATLLSLVGAAWSNGRWGAGSFYPNATSGFALLLFGGTTLHGWLYERRPPATALTRYYLAIAAGGALGGTLAALVAPLLFTGVTEYPLALCALMLLSVWRLTARLASRPVLAHLRVPLAAIAVLLQVLLLQTLARKSEAKTIFAKRNFYHPVRVTQTLERHGDVVTPIHYLWCGQTTHGLQVMVPGFDQRETSYYSSVGGGVAFASHPKYKAGQPLKVAVVGLGAGCLASYGRPDDLFRFHEINPLMFEVAANPRLFTFLADAPMPIDFVPGDARLSLEKERAAHDPLYDILVVDAYSGDAVPYQLATREAFRLYFDRLAPDGILAMHVSNWHIDLLPLCKAAAHDLNVSAYGLLNHSDHPLVADSLWVFLTRTPLEYTFPRRPGVREVIWEKIPDFTLPTDERGSLLPLLR